MIHDKYIKTKEEARLFYNSLGILLEKIYYKLQGYFYKINRFDLMHTTKAIKNYFKFMEKISPKGRLAPQGKLESIMFIGLNPSITSNFKDVWKDRYGLYLKICLDKSEISPEKIWMTNLYKKATDNNRVLLDSEIKEGMRELLFEIPYVRPKIIVVLGQQVHRAFGLEEKYTFEKRALQCKGEVYPVTLVAFPHPTYIQLYATDDERSEFINQLKKLKEYE
jgi:uracil-DNA glycosylase family 4